VDLGWVVGATAVVYSFDLVIFREVSFDDSRVGSVAAGPVDDIGYFFDRGRQCGVKLFRGKIPPGQSSDGV
jgi:hypothetical protein